MDARTRLAIARVGAPVAFLVCVTIVVLLIRSGLGAAPGSDPQDGTSGPPPAGITAGRSYVVARGDTLAAIAQRFGTTVVAITELNPGIDPVNLRIGQRIRVA